MISINILMTIFAALLLGIGSYLFTHRNRHFLIFHPERIPLLSSVIRNFGIAFVLSGGFAIITIFTQNTIWICSSLIIGCLAVTAFYLCISKFMTK